MDEDFKKYIVLNFLYSPPPLHPLQVVPRVVPGRDDPPAAFQCLLSVYCDRREQEGIDLVLQVLGWVEGEAVSLYLKRDSLIVYNHNRYFYP